MTDIENYTKKLILILEKNNNNSGLPIPLDSLNWVLRQSRTIFMSEPMLIKTTSPIKVVGDLHGQFSDLLNIFKKLDNPSNQNKYIFLGDYVDRGVKSLETILLLFCYKILLRNNIILLRGNHECADISRDYGFYDECKRRCSIKIWKSFIDVFDTMSIAATIGITKDNPLAFCVHGGISEDIDKLEDINRIKKPIDIPDKGLVCDLLWSDPSHDIDYYSESERGCSYKFGLRALTNFLKKIGVELVIRAHEVVEDGYELFFNRKLVTVFSAPNYANEFDNAGGVMIINKDFRCSFEIFR